MKPATIRPIALCVCRRGQMILVAELYDSIKALTFYRPLGGSIEFGEYSPLAIQREFREELGVDLLDVRYLGMLENIFICEGQPGHEIVLVYDGRLEDDSLYACETITGDEGGSPFTALWLDLGSLTPASPPLYPDGLLALLEKDGIDSGG